MRRAIATAVAGMLLLLTGCTGLPTSGPVQPGLLPREATTQAQLLGMHEEETYKHDPLDTSRKRVLYWLLFIAERYVCFQAVLAKANGTSEPTQSTNIARSLFTRSSTRPLWMKYLQTGQSPSVWS